MEVREAKSYRYHDGSIYTVSFIDYINDRVYFRNSIDGETLYCTYSTMELNNRGYWTPIDVSESPNIDQELFV